MHVIIIVFSVFSAPSAVRELTLTVNASHLIVTWDVPMLPNGMISLYSVMLAGINLVDSESIEIDDSSVNVTETMYTVAHSSLPYSNYTAQVSAFTIGGFSPAVVDFEQTPAEGKRVVSTLISFYLLLPSSI